MDPFRASTEALFSDHPHDFNDVAQVQKHDMCALARHVRARTHGNAPTLVFAVVEQKVTEISSLVVRMAEENRRLGYRRIRGALANLNPNQEQRDLGEVALSLNQRNGRADR